MSTNEDVQPGKLMMDLLMGSLTVRLSAMNGRPPGAPWKVFSFVLAEGKYGKIWKNTEPLLWPQRILPFVFPESRLFSFLC